MGKIRQGFCSFVKFINFTVKIKKTVKETEGQLDLFSY